MLDGEKMRIYTRGDHCVFLYKKIKFYKGVQYPCVSLLQPHENLYKEYPYVFEKYYVKNREKQGGVICKGGLSVGNSNDMQMWL